MMLDCCCSATLQLEGVVYECGLPLGHKGKHTFASSNGKAIQLRWTGDDREWHFRATLDRHPHVATASIAGMNLVSFDDKGLVWDAMITPESGVVSSEQAKTLLITTLEQLGCQVVGQVVELG